MKIDIWSDFICPFCYIGKRRFESALDAFSHKDHVIVEYKSYELDASAKRNPGKSIHELMAGKFGVSLEKAKAMNADIGRQAEEAGLNYNFDTIQHTNTFDAHRLAKFAQAMGKGNEMTERLLKAYFTEGKHIGTHDTLIMLAQEIGLDENEAAAVLDGNDYASHVRADEKMARHIGVQGVPFFVFNEKYAVSGAQSEEVFTQVFEKAQQQQSERKALQTIPVEDSHTGYCTGDGCT